MEKSFCVIICTHNPRLDYLDRVLQALDAQTLSKDLWELLLIDNASDKVLSSEIDLSWHPNAHHIREEQLGLTPARLRGIREAKAENLIFVDDDNVLDPNYIEVSLKISKDWPILGAWGGQLIPQFEEQPPEWTKPYWGMLSIYEFDQDRWSNVQNADTDPRGAGMCVRKVVTDKYVELVRNDPRRINLDRKGQSLTCGGDTDIALTACDIGLGMGRFASLKLTHLIPPKRLQEDYFVKLLEEGIYSTTILNSLRGDIPPLPKQSWARKLLEFYFLMRLPVLERRLYQARKRGEFLARSQLSTL